MGDTTSKDRLLAITGVAAGVIWALTSLAGDVLLQPPDPTGDPATIQQAYLEHQTAAWAMVLGSIYLAVAVVYFAAAVSRRLSSVHGLAALGGGVFLGVALLFHQGIGRFVLLSAARHHDTTSIHTLGYIDAVTWLLLSAASGTLLLATGIGALDARALPRWLSVATIVLGVLALVGPGALFFYMLAPFWFIAAGVMLRRRPERDAEPIAEDSTPTAPAPYRPRSR